MSHRLFPANAVDAGYLTANTPWAHGYLALTLSLSHADRHLHSMRRDRERSIAAFHAALQELQRSSLLPQCNIHVTAADDLAGSDLMSFATDAVTAVGMIEKYMEANANSHGWQGIITLSVQKPTPAHTCLYCHTEP